VDPQSFRARAVWATFFNPSLAVAAWADNDWLVAAKML
jgi:hypothetical protein